MQSKTTPVVQTHDALRRLTLSAMFLAIGLILPFFTGQIQQIGQMLCPMHLPVLLCGLVCGWQYGTLVGLVLPPLRSVLFGMPVLFPTAAAMAVELAVYGASIGILYALFKKQNVFTVYFALIPAMLLGRAAWGGAQMLFLDLKGTTFTWQAFMAGAFVNALPGIILQLVLIPAIMMLLNATGALRFRGKGEQHD